MSVVKFYYKPIKSWNYWIVVNGNFYCLFDWENKIQRMHNIGHYHGSEGVIVYGNY